MDYSSIVTSLVIIGWRVRSWVQDQLGVCVTCLSLSLYIYIYIFRVSVIVKYKGLEDTSGYQYGVLDWNLLGKGLDCIKLNGLNNYMLSTFKVYIHQHA